MKLQMHSIHFDADQKLIDFIQKKADKLDTYFDRIIDGEVFMRLDNHEKKENKVVKEINIQPGFLYEIVNVKNTKSLNNKIYYLMQPSSRIVRPIIIVILAAAICGQPSRYNIIITFIFVNCISIGISDRVC